MGNAVYLHCDFDFYGDARSLQRMLRKCVPGLSVPDLRTPGQKRRRPVFYEGAGMRVCDRLPVRGSRKESMGTSRALQVQWTRYPQPETMCYAYGNDTPIGPAEHTVDLTGKKGLRAFLIETKSGVQYNVRNLLRGTDALGSARTTGVPAGSRDRASAGTAGVKPGKRRTNRRTSKPDPGRPGKIFQWRDAGASRN